MQNGTINLYLGLPSFELIPNFAVVQTNLDSNKDRQRPKINTLESTLTIPWSSTQQKIEILIKEAAIYKIW